MRDESDAASPSLLATNTKRPTQLRSIDDDVDDDNDDDDSRGQRVLSSRTKQSNKSLLLALALVVDDDDCVVVNETKLSDRSNNKCSKQSNTSTSTS